MYLVHIILIFSFVTKIQNITIKDNFKYCQKTNTIPFQINEICERTDNEIVQNGQFTILEKESHLLSGKGYFCLKEKVIIETWKTFWNNPDSKKTKITILLSREECMAMHLTKTCSDNINMKCNGKLCISEEKDPNIEYYYFGPNRIFESYNCKSYTEEIFANNLKEKVFSGAINNCLPSDLYCILPGSTLFWYSNIVLSCLFTKIKQANLRVTGKIAIGKNYLFQITNTTNECDMTILHTTEGVYLTKDPNSLSLPNSVIGLNAEKHLMLADIDLGSYKIYTLIAKMNQDFIERSCYQNFLLIELMENQIDEFFVIRDNLKKEVILYNKDGEIIIANCNNVTSIEFSLRNQYCYYDIPIRFNFNNETTTGFLTNEGIIRKDSKIVDCSHVRTIGLPNKSSKLILTRSRIKLLHNDKSKNIQFLTKDKIELNFEHGKELNVDYDIDNEIKRYQNVLEGSGNFLIKPPSTFIEKNILPVGKKGKYHDYILNWFHNILLYLAVIIILIILSTLLYKHYSNRKGSSNVTEDHNMETNISTTFHVNSENIELTEQNSINMRRRVSEKNENLLSQLQLLLKKE